MILRGEVYRARLDPVLGCEQGGIRPVLIVQNNVGNKYSPTVIALPVTSKLTKAKLPTHVEVPAGQCGLAKPSLILAEQVRTLDKQRLIERLGCADEILMAQVNQALRMSMQLKD